MQTSSKKRPLTNYIIKKEVRATSMVNALKNEKGTILEVFVAVSRQLPPAIGFADQPSEDDVD